MLVDVRQTEGSSLKVENTAGLLTDTPGYLNVMPRILPNQNTDHPDHPHSYIFNLFAAKNTKLLLKKRHNKGMKSLPRRPRSSKFNDRLVVGWAYAA